MVYRPDLETENNTPQQNGWFKYEASGANPVMAYETDSAGYRGKVLHLSSNATAALSGTFVLGNVASGLENPNDEAWQQGDYRHLGLWLRNADPAHTPCGRH